VDRLLTKGHGSLEHQGGPAICLVRRGKEFTLLVHRQHPVIKVKEVLELVNDLLAILQTAAMDNIRLVEDGGRGRGSLTSSTRTLVPVCVFWYSLGLVIPLKFLNMPARRWNIMAFTSPDLATSLRNAKRCLINDES